MAYEKIIDSVSFPANSDLNSHQFKLVKFTAGKLTIATAAGEEVIGVISNDPNTDEGGLVVTLGVAKVLLGGSVTQGDRLTTGASATAITVADRNDYVFGKALATGVSGDVIPVLVTPVPMREGITTGWIPLPLAQARELSSNDTINTAGDAGVLSKNTTPILEAINGATDQKLQIKWAASNSDVLAWDVPLPADLDGSAAMTVYFRAKSAGATDTPVLTVTAFFNEGDTNCGGNTAAISAAYASKSVALAAGDVPEAPGGLTVTLAPGAHTTDAVHVTAAWIEYTRK